MPLTRITLRGMEKLEVTVKPVTLHHNRQISEKEVSEVMQEFFVSLNQNLEPHIVRPAGHVLPQSEIPNTLMSGLKQIFAAMEKFTANSVQAYKELCVHIQEDRHV